MSGVTNIKNEEAELLDDSRLTELPHEPLSHGRNLLQLDCGSGEDESIVNGSENGVEDGNSMDVEEPDVNSETCWASDNNNDDGNIGNVLLDSTEALLVARQHEQRQEDHKDLDEEDAKKDDDDVDFDKEPKETAEELEDIDSIQNDSVSTVNSAEDREAAIREGFFVFFFGYLSDSIGCGAFDQLMASLMALMAPIMAMGTKLLKKVKGEDDNGQEDAVQEIIDNVQGTGANPFTSGGGGGGGGGPPPGVAEMATAASQGAASAGAAGTATAGAAAAGGTCAN
ncbi:expressed unknown protein [Seminavis robusta]|uniref:Uncharacterized protein n=1 Tax=Seminavis robusta TaxID=568900 RepID=A0A9N8DIA0_9STRA|nr:expressed unknown protein [Seminavis robusta]|eukprot:Sro136_g063910.1 n/a (284) ;mRNA; r:1459-2310